MTMHATPPDGHVLMPDGKVRRVIGILPITADGVVVGHETKVFRNAEDGVRSLGVGLREGDTGWITVDTCGCCAWSIDPSQCYSTEEAALTARKDRGEVKPKEAP